MEEAGTAPARVVAVGGGTEGGLWTQIVSDVSGLERDVPEQTIRTAYGDALLAAIGAGLAGSETDWTATRETVRPRAEHRGLYDELFELYPAIAQISHRLAALQHGTTEERG